MLGDKQATEEQHKPWNKNWKNCKRDFIWLTLKKTRYYLSKSKKVTQIWETNILENSYNVFDTWLKFYYYLDK